MNRREVLKYVSWVTGAAIATPILGGLLSGCQADAAAKVENYIPRFLNKNEFSLIENLVDIILPKTDSPAGTEVGVHKMIDHMIFNTYKAEDQQAYRKGLQSLARYLSKTAEDAEMDWTALVQLDNGQKETLLNQLQKSDEENIQVSKSAFMSIKQQSIAYYLSTEEIGTKFLNYLPVPGAYEACISLEEAGGKAWAL